MIKFKLNNDALSYSEFIGPLVQITLKGASSFFKTFQQKYEKFDDLLKVLSVVASEVKDMMNNFEKIKKINVEVVKTIG